MNVSQVILFCNYTSNKTRSHLQLSDMKFDNLIRRTLGIPALKYIDAAPWIEAFIRFFQGDENYHLHVVAIQMGMKKEFESFDEDGVSYHYVKSGLSFWAKVSDKLFDTQRKSNFSIYRKRFVKALNGIKPDLMLICGAENPDYASLFLNTDCPHKLVIMQTLMNDEKRIQMGVSNAYRREIEDRVLSHCRHFAVPDASWIQYVKNVNSSAECYPFTFPTIKPVVSGKVDKIYDFVFFAGILGRNKGTNDLVSAMAILCKKFPNATLNIIGGANEEYMKRLHQQVEDNGLESNIIFTPPFAKREDVFYEVCKSKVAVLPGITASLNSTVREAMLMGIPTLVYETLDTKKINSEELCLFTARMEDVSDLARQLDFALTHPSELADVAKRAQLYAELNFSQNAFNNDFFEIINKVIAE